MADMKHKDFNSNSRYVMKEDILKESPVSVLVNNF